MSEKYLVDAITEGEGNVKIADDVIATIAAVAAESIDGVVELQSTLKASVTDMLGVKNLAKGVKVSVGENEAIIDLFLTVEYGKNIVSVSKEVQEKVKEAIETMTSLNVIEVNIHVSGIAMVDKEKVRA
ncbi:Asp23/Gls24 family envelope stress response protein [Peptoniphilus stercorisuis]|uniref:Alkaline shock family protein YloU n=1 Tax=Peptoniphilus stercorisuis TaxID=1436965 RepID=A0ABS4KB50_9FIRM|nr:Asp23/Gls24 family envelope stress response protein [Peptoniphilus stercorisuis]MBP2024998.1 putative alkaline shock family protein YloU [Peptoniphilus stercorisuis]